MQQYRYVGDDSFFQFGETALGRIVNGMFKVQVDRFEHPWSHGWHDTIEEDWEQEPNDASL